MIEFVQLPGRPRDWDELIRPYYTKTLFHESSWLDHVQTIHPKGRIEFFELREAEKKVGFFCALRIRKMLLPIAGSPMGGTGTNFMGPVVGRDVDQRELIRSLVRSLRRRGVAHLELSHYWLDPQVLREEGFQQYYGRTHMIDLPPEVDGAWEGLKGTARNRVRKALDNGLVAEVTTDLTIADHYIAQFAEVYGKQGMALPYDRARVRSLVENLLPADRILPIWVKHGDEIVATGLFPFDEKCLYFWGGASWLKHQRLSPNDLLQWTAMEQAVSRGIPLYNMCGGYSQFKNKFGGEDVEFLRYSRSFLPFLQTARNLYYRAHHWALRRRAGAA
jgi:hypothetical protein